jgi:hypothetical protein
LCITRAWSVDIILQARSEPVGTSSKYRIVSYRIVSYRIVSYRIVSYRIVSYDRMGISVDGYCTDRSAWTVGVVATEFHCDRNNATRVNSNWVKFRVCFSVSGCAPFPNFARKINQMANLDRMIRIMSQRSTNIYSCFAELLDSQKRKTGA